MYIFFLLLCTNSGSTLHEVRRGLVNDYRGRFVWTAGLFNISCMLVNLTHLKHTAIHYAKSWHHLCTDTLYDFLAWFTKTWAGQTTDSHIQNPKRRDQLLFPLNCAHVEHAGVYPTHLESKTWGSIMSACFSLNLKNVVTPLFFNGWRLLDWINKLIFRVY